MSVTVPLLSARALVCMHGQISIPILSIIVNKVDREQSSPIKS